MTIDEVRQLHRGDEVKWTDPDDGICTKILEIVSITIRDEVVAILSVDDQYLECYAEELS